MWEHLIQEVLMHKLLTVHEEYLQENLECEGRQQQENTREFEIRQQQ